MINDSFSVSVSVLMHQLMLNASAKLLEQLCWWSYL